jgi:hypothetical protein
MKSLQGIAMKNWIAPLSLTLLAGCQSAPPRDVGSLYRAAPNGLHIRLERPLNIPSDSATVRLQFGHPVASNAMQDTEPYCTFELSTVSDKPQPVEPDIFQVTKIEQRIQDFAGMPVWPTAGMLGLFGRGSGPSQIYYVTQFRLAADHDSHVRSLSCQSNQSSLTPPQQRHLTLDEMRGAVGDYFRFELAR